MDKQSRKPVLDPFNAIKEWLFKITQSHPALGGHRICPFAKKMPKVISTDFFNETDICPDLELTIYVEVSRSSSYQDLIEICQRLRQKHKTHVFLPDHPLSQIDINGIKTGNGVYPCILVQPESELENARKKLEKTDYYTYWKEESLLEIKNFQK